jgi:hypothetical protein
LKTDRVVAGSDEDFPLHGLERLALSLGSLGAHGRALEVPRADEHRLECAEAEVVVRLRRELLRTHLREREGGE